MLSHIIDLLYPHLCASCGVPIGKNDDMICHLCFEKMAFCPYKPGFIHPIEKIFWGRSRISAATSLFVFSKHGTGQQLLHRLKYKGDKEVGVFLGRLLGRRIIENPAISGVDVIIPVPLNDRKQRVRGYNQSQVIGEGIAAVAGVPVADNYLLRNGYSESQTKKGRLERVENVSGAFSLREQRNPAYGHVLIVDDVITTGSTLEACINLLSPYHKVSVATLAYQ